MFDRPEGTWIASLPFFAVSLGLGLVTMWFQHHRAIGGEDLAIGGWPSRIAAAGLAIGFYLGKFAWPAALLPIYPRWHLTPPSAAQFLPWVVIVAVAGWLGSRRGREEMTGRERTALFGLGCFGVNLLPVLGFIPMSYLQQSWVADHFVYLPMLGLIGLVSAGAAAAMDRAWPRPASVSLLAVGVAGACALLAFAGHRYASIFRNGETLWGRTLRGNPDSWTAHDDLGLVLFAKGRMAEAADHYGEALRLKPDFADAHNNLGLVWRETGRIPEAIAQFEEALQAQPDSAETHNNLGIALGVSGRTAEAIAHPRRRCRSGPTRRRRTTTLVSRSARPGGRRRRSPNTRRRCASIRTMPMRTTILAGAPGARATPGRDRPVRGWASVGARRSKDPLQLRPRPA